jgi:hypothetical protein
MTDSNRPDDNVISFAQAKAAHTKDNGALDDDKLIHRAGEKIAEWQAAGTPSLTAVQELFYELICAGASPMARDRIVEALIAAFGTEVGGKRALISTWNKLAKDFAAECAQGARDTVAQRELTPEEKTALREALWPTVRELAQAPDLINRVVQQVQRRRQGREHCCSLAGSHNPDLSTPAHS